MLAPSNDKPATVEVREDTSLVELPVIDLYSTVSQGSGVAKADTSKPVTVFVKGQKPVKVFPGQKSVQIPVSAGSAEMNVVATDTSGQPVSAPIQVKKVLKPLVATSDSSSGSSFPWLWIAIAVLVLLAGGAAVTRSRRGAAAPTQE